MKIKEICSLFDINGEFIEYKLLTEGNINTTYQVSYNDDNKKVEYILQCINSYVFNNPVKVMENILSVTEHIKNKYKMKNMDYKRMVLECKKTKDNLAYVIDDDNHFWRCYEYIDNSLTFNVIDDLSVVQETGKAFGEFQLYLNDYNADKLNIVIKDFHNTIARYNDFESVIESGIKERINDTRNLINEYLCLKDKAVIVENLYLEGELPLRVVHNDTKANNVLFDVISNKHLAVIDLDTVMPGLVAYDFGDAIRFIASSSKEDEEDVSKVFLDLDKFEAFTRGFLTEIGGELTREEMFSLSWGAIAITIECGIRFLSDYLNGDKYFKIRYDEHNLVRSKCQLKLAKDMISKVENMNFIINKYI